MIRKILPPVIYREQFAQIFFAIREVFGILWSISPGLTILVLALSSFFGFLSLPIFYLEKLILDKLVGSIGTLNWQAAIYPLALLIGARALVETIRNVIGSIQAYAKRIASRSFNIRVEIMLGEKLATLDAQTINDPIFQDRYNKIERQSGNRGWSLIMSLTDIPGSVLGLISSAGILLFLSPLIVILAVVVTFPVILIDRDYVKKGYELDSTQSLRYRIYGWLASYLQETRRYYELKILSLQGPLATRMKNISNEFLEEDKNLRSKREKARIWTYFPYLLYYGGTNIYLAFLVITTKITVGSYEMFLRALLSVGQNFSTLFSSFLEIYENYVYVEDLHWFMNLKPQMNVNENGEKVEKVINGIEFRDVWFKYAEDKDWILKGINLDLVPGERIAIVGENGAGKSTLIKLLTRFYDPSKGILELDGKDVKLLNYEYYHKRFAVLFQDFEAYPFSVIDTIGFGDVRRIEDIEGIKAAAKKADIDGFVESLPLKYENPLNQQFEKGVQLSGGQWQRFGIARMLFRENADILVLDEPTSNVDPEAEEKIFNELLKKSKSKILIFVSQRFSTVRRADKILVVDKGKIIEQGTHEELMKLQGKYERLFNLQAKGYR